VALVCARLRVADCCLKEQSVLNYSDCSPSPDLPYVKLLRPWRALDLLLHLLVATMEPRNSLFLAAVDLNLHFDHAGSEGWTSPRFLPVSEEKTSPSLSLSCKSILN
jgi:hypothetical protein